MNRFRKNLSTDLVSFPHTSKRRLTFPCGHGKILAGIFGLCLWFSAPTELFARINVVNLPERHATQLTIYNSVDLTLVRETRVLTVRPGINRLEFSWANTLIDPTSLELRALTHADAVEVLDASFPPRVTNTLEWRLQSEYRGEIEVEIRYFTSGIRWSADYVAEADRGEKNMAMSGAVRVTNNSGEDYENAQVRLIVGVVRLVEEIAQLAQPKPSATPALSGRALFDNLDAKNRGVVQNQLFFAEKLAEAKPREIVKEGLSEYFMYTVAGRDTIPNGWSKQLPSFKAAEIPIVSYYKFEKEQWGDEVRRFYRFKNDTTSKLGKEPLPDGQLHAFRLAGEDRAYAYVGATPVKYIPLNEQVELDFGEDTEVQVKPSLVNWEKTDVRFNNAGDVDGWTIKETWLMELQNSKEIPVTVDARRNFDGDWNLTSAAPYTKMDTHKVKFETVLKPREKKIYTYELVTRYGVNASR